MPVRPARNSALLLALGLVPLLVAPTTGAEKLTVFPSEVVELRSPDGKYVLRNLDSDDEPHHTLYLRDAARKSEEKLLTYDRHVGVIWSSDGRRLIVNDHAGSDSANCLIFLFGEGTKRVDVRQELEKQLGTNKSIFGNHHVYIECVAWPEPGVAKVKISGHGDVNPKGFTLFYRYPIEGRFAALPASSGPK